MKHYLSLFAIFVFLSVGNIKGENSNGYKGFIDFAVGDAYNLNTAQTISTNNMQWYTEITTTHGYMINHWFVGAGIGYYHSYRDKENMFPFYAAGGYTFEKAKVKPFLEVRVGIIFDPLWFEKVQAYGAFSVGIDVYKGLQLELRGSIFGRPSRFFTANAAFVIGYAFGK